MDYEFDIEFEHKRYGNVTITGSICVDYTMHYDSGVAYNGGANLPEPAEVSCEYEGFSINYYTVCTDDCEVIDRKKNSKFVHKKIEKLLNWELVTDAIYKNEQG